MMKKNVLCALLALVFTACSNEEVIRQDDSTMQPFRTALRNSEGIDRSIAQITSDDAMKVASLFAKAESVITRSETEKAISSVTPIKNDEGIDVMFVVQYADNAGWSIISASKKTEPILAYAEEGGFDFNNETFNDWLETQKAMVTEALKDEKDIRSPYWLQYEKDDLGIIADTRSQYVDIRTWRHNTIGDIEDGVYDSYEDNTCPTGYGQEDYYFSSGSQVNSYFNGDVTNIIQVAQERLTNRGYSEDYALYHLRIYRYDSQVLPLISTSWHQGYPYNDSIPGHAPVGCNAIAIGQIMNYHQHPNTFNWSQINIYGSALQKGFLKQLFLDLDTSYNPSDGQSTAFVSRIKPVLEDYGYTVTQSTSYNYSLMKTELENRRPMILVGFTSYSDIGHTYICDGYRDYTYNTYYLTVYLPNVNMPSNGLLDYNPYSPQTDLRTSNNYNSTYNQWHLNWGEQTNSLVWVNYGIDQLCLPHNTIYHQTYCFYINK